MKDKITTPHYKRTKIIATIGPAITQKLWNFEMFENPKNKELVKAAYEKMTAAIENGVTCLRLNFSHGDYNEQMVRIKIAREVFKKLNRNISIMLDTKGPEIRINPLVSEFVNITKGQELKIVTTNNKFIGDNKKIGVSDSTGTYNMAKDVKVGQIILIDDGKLELTVTSVDIKKGIIKSIATNNHVISEKRRINLPDSDYSMPFLSDKDKNDIIWACKNNIDYIAASFVNNASHVHEIREILNDNNKSNIQIISKIETGTAISNLDSIVKASDGIMIARGDLGLEIPYYDVPYWEKKIIRVCRTAGKPVIVATQMLDSLERNVQPTRAEVTDVFFAVERGTDATMLSGESAKGQFPIEAIQIMSKINKTSEKLYDYNKAVIRFASNDFPKDVKKIVDKVNNYIIPKENKAFPHDFIVAFTNNKFLIKALSATRPAATVIVVTSETELLTAFGINYAIQTYYVKDLNLAKFNYKDVCAKAIKSISKTLKKAVVLIDGKISILKIS